MENNNSEKPEGKNSNNPPIPKATSEKVTEVAVKEKESLNKHYLFSKDNKIALRGDKIFSNGKDITDSLKQGQEEINPIQEAEKKSRQVYKEWIGQQPNYNVVVLSGPGSSYGIAKDSVPGMTL